jgi:enamine deaminase RidA (YjgF/YER057c/UK114 family)
MSETARVEHLNPEELPQNPAFSQVVAVSGSVKTIYIGGQNAVTAEGEIVGERDIGAQSEQVLSNLAAALAAAGARLEHVIKWSVHVVEGQPLESAFAVFQRVWGQRPDPPLITLAFVSGLALPEFLVELEAVAIVPV